MRITLKKITEELLRTVPTVKENRFYKALSLIANTRAAGDISIEIEDPVKPASVEGPITPMPPKEKEPQIPTPPKPKTL